MEIICPRCSVVLPLKEEGEKVFAVCSTCGYREEFIGWVEHHCKRCGHDKAIVVYHALVRGDEDTTALFKCINCGSTGREGYLSD